MTLEPIAVVRNEIKEMGKHKWEEVVSLLILRPDLEEALDGLEEFSHIIVVFWMHLNPVGLDALDGTPVIDIKPYLPGDSVTDLKAPDWVYKLRQQNSG